LWKRTKRKNLRRQIFDIMERMGRMLYNAGDTVLYGARGVCRITDIEENEMTGKKVKYYILRPVYDEKAKIFVPTTNETLCAKMRRTLSIKEIYALIKSMKKEETNWIQDENQRRREYKQILTGGDCKEIIKVIKTLHKHQQSQIEDGKKLHVADERLMKDAEQILHEEFAYVLDIQPEEVLSFIVEQIDA